MRQGPNYVTWLSIRHQDGRRESGKGFNLSLRHIRSASLYHTLCGREIGIVANNLSHSRGDCKRCVAIWKANAQ